MDQLAVVVMVVLGGGWFGGFGELVNQVVELVEPCLVEQVEPHFVKVVLVCGVLRERESRGEFQG